MLQSGKPGTAARNPCVANQAIPQLPWYHFVIGLLLLLLLLLEPIQAIKKNLHIS